MDAKQFCNNIYRDMVARLGELTIQLDQIEKEKESIKAQLALLNALSPELQKLEKLELQTEEAKAAKIFDGYCGC